MATLKRAGAAVLLAGLLACLPSVAAAQGADEDPRATQHTGNAVEKDCATLWPGSTAVTITDVEVTQEEGEDKYLDILSVPEGFEIVGVIVKGGNQGYNKYQAAALQELPWLDLRAPNNPSGKPAGISHWFACGVKITTTTTTTTTATTTTTTGVTTGVTTTTTPVTTTTPDQTTTPGETTAPATTTTDALVPGGGDDLADTGANTGWLLITGLLLLLAGGLALMSPRVRAVMARR